MPCPFGQCPVNCHPNLFRVSRYNLLLLLDNVQLSANSLRLQDALLGVSAFHLRYLDGSDTTLTQASYTFMSRAIAQHARNLCSGINAENGEVVFATSILIGFHATSCHRLLFCEENNDVMPLHWFVHWRGMRAILAQGWRYINGDLLKHVVTQETLLELQLLSNIRPLDPEVFSFLLDDLDCSSVDQETLNAYKTCVSWLSKAYIIPLVRHIIKFTATAPPRFIEMLKQKDPRTLTIMGYFFMLVKKLDGSVWWLQGAAEREFWMLMKFIPDEWKPKMEVSKLFSSSPLEEFSDRPRRRFQGS